MDPRYWTWPFAHTYNATSCRFPPTMTKIPEPPGWLAGSGAINPAAYRRAVFDAVAADTCSPAAYTRAVSAGAACATGAVSPAEYTRAVAAP